MSHIAGGYLYDFIPDVPLNYICVSCNLPLKKPHQISICGHRVCLQCFQNIKQESEASNEELICPFDDENINGGKVYPDIAVEKELLNWNVKCVNHINNCLWVGPLKEIEEHEVLCKKDASETKVLEPEFMSKADFEMVILKLCSLESRIEVYESKVAYCEQKMEISNAELASCKATLSEKCNQLTMIQSELNMLKSILFDEKNTCKKNLKFDVECETEFKSMITSGKCDVINSKKLEQILSVNCTKIEDSDDMTLIYQDKSNVEDIIKYEYVSNREAKANIVNAADNDKSDTKIHNSQKKFNRINLQDETSYWICINKNKKSETNNETKILKPQIDRNKTDSIKESNNMLANTAHKKTGAKNTAHIVPNVLSKIYSWEPKNILQWGTANITLLSPQFNNKDFRFQFRIKNKGENIIFSFLHPRSQVLLGCKCAVVFISKSGKNRHFEFDLGESEEKSKNFPVDEFTKYFMDVETKIYFQILG